MQIVHSLGSHNRAVISITYNVYNLGIRKGNVKYNFLEITLAQLVQSTNMSPTKRPCRQQLNFTTDEDFEELSE